MIENNIDRVKSKLVMAYCMLDLPRDEMAGEVEDVLRENMESFRNAMDEEDLEEAINQLETLAELTDFESGFWREMKEAAQMLDLESRLPYYNKMMQGAF